MQRRNFLGLAALAGAAAPLAKLRASRSAAIRYKVTGFTCPTCAIGLETLLKREPGVLHAQATYPEGEAMVSYDPARIMPAKLQALMEEMGFHATAV